MTKSDQISTFFKKSGPEIIFVHQILPFWARCEKEEQKTPLRGICDNIAQAGMKENHPIIQSNNPLHGDGLLQFVCMKN